MLTAAVAVPLSASSVVWHVLASLPIVVVVAWLAGRLLGAHASWARSLLAGLLGALAGGAAATVIAHTRHSRAGFTGYDLLFSLIFTMSALVWLEMLARPGTLVQAQAGLLTLPRPVRALRTRWQRVSRYAEITRIAARHGLGPALGLGHRPAGHQAHPRVSEVTAAVRLREGLEECGGMFVKVGQVLSTRSDLLPPAFIEELSVLQDDVAPADPGQVQALVQAELGQPVDEVFSSFDWAPIASASIGQAYKAVLREGQQPVVVKVQRPNVAELVHRDVGVLRQITGVMEHRTAWGHEYQVSQFANEFAERITEELDFRLEGQTATEIAQNIRPGLPVHVPKVYRQLTTRRVLVMEWLDGKNIRDGTSEELPAEQRKQLADALMRCMLDQMMVYGRFHADPHPGNVLVLRQGGLGLVDYGAAGRLDPLQQAGLRDLLLAITRRNPAGLRQAVLEVATVRGDIDDDLLERALARFTARHMGAGAVPSAGMFTELMQLCLTFGLVLPPELSTFFRALLTLEGTLRVMSPGYSAIEAAQQMAGEYMHEQLTPQSLADTAEKELLDLVPVLRRLPVHVERLAGQLERGQLVTRISLFAEEGDRRFVTRLVNRAVLTFIGGVVALLSAVLLTTHGGPSFAPKVSMYQFFGYFGLFCGSTLILRVLFAVLHDRLN